MRDAMLLRMTGRAHFWLRFGGLFVIVLAELLPRLATHESSAKGARGPRGAIAETAEIAHR